MGDDLGTRKFREEYDQRTPRGGWPRLRDWLKHCAETWPPGFDVLSFTVTRRTTPAVWDMIRLTPERFRAIEESLGVTRG